MVRIFPSSLSWTRLGANSFRLPSSQETLTPLCLRLFRASHLVHTIPPSPSLLKNKHVQPLLRRTITSSASIVRLMEVAESKKDRKWLEASLQASLELELSTIPPYLCCLWSMKEPLSEVYDLIRSIVLDEMLHVGLAANMLTAIGATPKFNTPQALPKYPSVLPGGVRPELHVHLQGLTKEYIKNILMEIETPEHGPVALHKGFNYPTIGSFYHAILSTFQRLIAENSVSITGERQMTSWVGGGEGLFPIHSIENVARAIEQIRHEGEGTSQSPHTGVPHDPTEYAHYYKLAQVYHGRKLIQVGEQYQYAGDLIDFPEVFPMAKVPPEGYAASREFDILYSRMVDKLNDAWAQGSQSSLDEASGDMFALGDHATRLMSTPIDSTQPELGNLGPSFIYYPKHI